MFNHLSDREFEELTYDLLVHLGFVNVDWRRGTGMEGASADQGRDIVGQYRRKDVDGSERFEMWFVQCKQYKRGVPPDKVQDAFAWAAAERPDVLVIAVSNFLSNSAKNWIKTYEERNHPSFHIKVWERKNLEGLVAGAPALAVKYELPQEGDVSAFHSAHTEYLRHPSLNTLGFFFEIVDGLKEDARNQLFAFGFEAVINPRLRKPKTNHETLAELQIETVDYAAFRRRCYELSRLRLAEYFLVQSLVLQALHWAWMLGDPLNLRSTLARHEEFAAALCAQAEAETDEEKRADLGNLVAFVQRMDAQAPHTQEVMAGYYRELCETVLPRLALEESQRVWTIPDRTAEA